MFKYVLLQHHQRKDTGFKIIERIKQLCWQKKMDNEMGFPSQNQMTTMSIEGSEAHPYLNIFRLYLTLLVHSHWLPKLHLWVLPDNDPVLKQIVWRDSKVKQAFTRRSLTVVLLSLCLEDLIWRKWKLHHFYPVLKRAPKYTMYFYLRKMERHKYLKYVGNDNPDYCLGALMTVISNNDYKINQ